MNKAVLLLILCLLSASAYGQDEYVFSDSVLGSYEKAVSLNDGKDFLGAYRELASAERTVEKELSARNFTADRLGTSDFQAVYWPVKKSLAEVAYVLGNHVVSRRIAEELRRIVAIRQWTDDDIAFRDSYLGDIFKIDADCFYLTGQFGEALSSLKSALKAKPFDSPGEDFKSKVLADMAQVYYRTADYDSALACLDSVLACSYYQSDGWNWTRQKADEVREYNTQRAITLARLGRYDEALAEIAPVLSYFKSKGNASLRQYAEVLRKKAKILMLRFDATGLYNPTAKTCYEEYLSVAKRFVDQNFARMSESEREQYWMAEQPFVADCYRLEAHAPELLYDVALFSKAILLQMGRTFTSSMNERQRSVALQSMRVTWQQVQRSLPASSVAVEFIAYDKGGRKRMGALVLGKTGRPSFVPLCTVDSLLNFRLSAGCLVKETLSGTSEPMANALYNDPQLGQIVWNSRLTKLIGASRRVYFSPDGWFHQIAVEYLVPGTLKQKSFYRMTSTRMLTLPHHKTRTGSMLMSGFIDYQSGSVPAQQGSNDQLAYSLMSSLHMNLATLYNSKNEIDSIRHIRSRRDNDKVVTWDEATEQTIRQLMQKYHVVLLSTHGYFTDAATTGTDIRPAQSDVQLSKSCLFFAGSVSNMNNPNFDSSVPDGILSARELAAMNLENVDLAVLSACQTGLGYITPDGVYGLQRGLKTAGVKAVVASLWPVNDESTSILMFHLFENLEKGMALHAAFNTARAQLRDTVSEFRGTARVWRRHIYNNPYFYDAFILIDGQE